MVVGLLYGSGLRWHDTALGRHGHHRLNPIVVQKAVKRAVGEAGVSKAPSCHSLCYPLAGARLEHPHDPGTPVASRREYDHDLYPCAQPLATWGT